MLNSILLQTHVDIGFRMDSVIDTVPIILHEALPVTVNVIGDEAPGTTTCWRARPRMMFADEKRVRPLRRINDLVIRIQNLTLRAQTIYVDACNLEILLEGYLVKQLNKHILCIWDAV